MKRIVITLLLGLFTISNSSYAQSYVYQKIVGASPHFGRSGEERVFLIEGPANDKLSGWQELPFTWKLYGEVVTGYYASENGYITFDRSAQTSMGENTVLPTTDGPNHAIYVFWDDWELTKGRSTYSKSVNATTYGTAPNRTHLISWIGSTPAGQEDVERKSSNYFLALHESGDFEILMNVSYNDVPLTGTIGVENKEGKLATMVENSPDYDFPSLKSNANDDITYQFEYVDKANQVRVTDVNLKETAQINVPFSLHGKIWNLGSNQINSCVINYQVDNEKPQQHKIKGVNIAQNTMHEFQHAIPWKPSRIGKYETLKFWVSAINKKFPNEDTDPLVKQVFVNLGKKTNKEVMVEEFTGTWCGWCPDGMVQIKKLMEEIDGIIPVAIHARHADSMATKYGEEWADLYRPAYPESMINRTLWPRESSVPISRVDDLWKHKIQEALAIISPVAVKIDKKYSPASRELEATVSAEFIDYGVPGDFRINFYIVEDKVTGEGKGYEQANFYSGNKRYADHIYYDKPNPMKGYKHQHVLREVLSGASGTAGVISQAPKPGDVFHHTYTYILPENYNPKEVKLVAFISYFDEDKNKRPVLNATQVDLIEIQQ